MAPTRITEAANGARRQLGGDRGMSWRPAQRADRGQGAAGVTSIRLDATVTPAHSTKNSLSRISMVWTSPFARVLR